MDKIMKIAISTESTCDLTKELYKKYNRALDILKDYLMI